MNLVGKLNKLSPLPKYQTTTLSGNSLFFGDPGAVGRYQLVKRAISFV
jgi:hypothetical protein